MSTAKWTLTFNADSGSDTQASGCGPATAVYGTAASYSGSVFSLDGAAGNLGSVTTDHILWVATSTGRRFFTIASVDDGAGTVTVNEAPAGTATGLAWAIGGKRIDPFDDQGADLNNAYLPADAGAGWTLELEGGTTADYGPTTGFTMTHGDNTNGPFRITAADLSAKPVVTLNGTNGAKIIYTANHNNWVIRGLRMECSPGTGARWFILGDRGTGWAVLDCEFISTATGQSVTGVAVSGNVGNANCIDGCYFEGVTYAISNGSTGVRGLSITNNELNGCGATGFPAIRTYRSYGCVIRGNVIYDSVDEGIGDASSAGFNYLLTVENNTIVSSGSHGINFQGDLRAGFIRNNIVTNSSGVGIKFSGGASQASVLVGHNCFGSGTGDGGANSSGQMSGVPAAFQLGGDVTANPFAGTSPDFSVDTDVQALGWPKTADGIAGQGNTASYIDIGAVQRQEPAGGGGNIYLRGANALLRR